MGVTDHLEDIYNFLARGLCGWTWEIKQFWLWRVNRKDVSNTSLTMFNTSVTGGRWVCFTLALGFRILGRIQYLGIFLDVEGFSLMWVMQLCPNDQSFSPTFKCLLPPFLSLQIKVFVKYLVTLSYQLFLVSCSGTLADTLIWYFLICSEHILHPMLLHFI